MFPPKLVRLGEKVKSKTKVDENTDDVNVDPFTSFHRKYLIQLTRQLKSEHIICFS